MITSNSDSRFFKKANQADFDTLVSRFSKKLKIWIAMFAQYISTQVTE